MQFLERSNKGYKGINKPEFQHLYNHQYKIDMKLDVELKLVELANEFKYIESNADVVLNKNYSQVSLA